MRRPKIPTGWNPWCGPFAIALVTGTSTDRAAGLIAAIRGRRKGQVRGTNTKHLVAALRLTHDVQTVAPDEPMTFARWCTRYGAAPGQLVVVQTMGHYLVACDGLVADNQTRRWIDPNRSAHYRRARIRRWYVVHPRGKSGLDTGDICPHITSYARALSPGELQEPDR